jgi:Flp pilus assembly protein TadG
MLPEIRKFRQSEAGTATVEAVIWLPIFFVVLFLMVDAAMIFNGQSQALRVVQDANRKMSIGGFSTPSEVEAYVVERLSPLSLEVSAISTVTVGVVTTTVTLPAADLQLSGFFGAFTNLTLSVSADHLVEDWEA